MQLRNKGFFWLGLYFISWTIYFLVVWSRAFTYDRFNNLAAGHVNLWGDWAVHFTMGSAMAFRNLILTDSPLLWGAPFRYPFFVNFFSAFLIRMGVPFFSAFVIPSFFFSLMTVAGLFVFYRVVFKSNRAAFISSCVFLFNGGLGFWWFIKDVCSSPRPWQAILYPVQTYTRIDSADIQWISVISSMIIPQRAFQLGFPLALASLALVFLWVDQKKWSLLLYAGLLWGVLPVVHIHSFGAVGVILACWCVGDLAANPAVDRVKAWLALFVTGLIVALPLFFHYQLLGGAAASMIKWKPGWYAESVQEWIAFWAKNWGITPAVALAGAVFWWRASRRRREKLHHFFFGLPFLILFAALNLILFQPWIWDNSKLLVWVSVGVSGLAGYALCRIKRVWIVAPLFVLMTASGALDAYRILIPRLNSYQMYTAEELSLAEWVRNNTDPQSVWLTGTHHNNWLFNLTGRRVLVTFEGWLWTHGYAYHAVQSDFDRMLSNPEDQQLYDKYNICFLAIGPAEIKKWDLKTEKFDFFFTPVKKTEHYVIYSTGRSGVLSNEIVRRDFSQPLAPALLLDEAGRLRPGLLQRVAPNVDFFGLSKRSVIASVGFDYPSDREKPIKSPFSLEIEGFLKVTEQGMFVFSLESDDGAWLTLDDVPVIDNGGIHAVKKLSSKVRLHKGLHKIKVRYFDSTGGAILKLFWKIPSGLEQPVPTDALYHD